MSRRRRLVVTLVMGGVLILSMFVPASNVLGQDRNEVRTGGHCDAVENYELPADSAAVAALPLEDQVDLHLCAVLRYHPPMYDFEQVLAPRGKEVIDVVLGRMHAERDEETLYEYVTLLNDIATMGYMTDRYRVVGVSCEALERMGNGYLHAMAEEKVRHMWVVTQEEKKGKVEKGGRTVVLPPACDFKDVEGRRGPGGAGCWVNGYEPGQDSTCMARPEGVR